MAIRDNPSFPDPVDGLDTDGEWWLVASFFMNVEDDIDYGTYHDVFTSGESQCSGSTVLIDSTLGALEPEQYELCFASLIISDELAAEDDLVRPAEFALAQNYPNPFNASTTIRYDLPRECDVSVGIFDLLGAKISTLVDGRQSAGRHSVTWDAGTLPSGMYLYKMRSEEFSKTMRLILIK